MNSFISWIGGKNYLKRAIYRRMPRDISSYIEAFGGAAWVLFYKDRYADTEVYNDFNGDLVNLFRCVKYHRPEIQRELSGWSVQCFCTLFSLSKQIPINRV